MYDDSEDTASVQSAPFSDLSERTKRRKSNELATAHEREKLLKATGQCAREEKKHDLGNLATAAGASPGRPKKIRAA